MGNEEQEGQDTSVARLRAALKQARADGARYLGAVERLTAENASLCAEIENMWRGMVNVAHVFVDDIAPRVDDPEIKARAEQLGALLKIADQRIADYDASTVSSADSSSIAEPVPVGDVAPTIEVQALSDEKIQRGAVWPREGTIVKQAGQRYFVKALHVSKADGQFVVTPELLLLGDAKALRLNLADEPARRALLWAARLSTAETRVWASTASAPAGLTLDLCAVALSVFSNVRPCAAAIRALLKGCGVEAGDYLDELALVNVYAAVRGPRASGNLTTEDAEVVIAWMAGEDHPWTFTTEQARALVRELLGALGDRDRALLALRAEGRAVGEGGAR